MNDHEQAQTIFFVDLPSPVEKKNTAAVEAVVRKLAHEAPELEDLSDEAIKRIAAAVWAEKLKDDMSRRVKLEQIDYEDEKAKWIARAGRSKSNYTRTNYAFALNLIEEWCAREKIIVLDMTPMQADEYIEYLKAKPKKRITKQETADSRYNSQTIITFIAAASAFFTWMERRHKGIHNPFRGTRSRPRGTPAKPVRAPQPEECERMIKTAKGELRAGIAVLVDTGLRVGALQPMTVSGEKLYTHTKGKDFSKILPERAREEIKKAELLLGHPFEHVKTATFQNRFNRLIKTMYTRGRLRHLYSPHDLRHARAVRLWLETKDIYLVSKFLGHATINTTQRYLRSLELQV